MQGHSKANRQRKLRTDELRLYLSERGKLSYVFDNIEKIEGLDVKSDDFQKDLLKLRTANEQRIKLLNKYLPDAKEEVESTADIPPLVIKLATDAIDEAAD